MDQGYVKVSAGKPFTVAGSYTIANSNAYTVGANTCSSFNRYHMSFV
jgi:hypothetical protein